MPKNRISFSAFERAIHLAANIVTTVCFVIMVWLAVHIVTDRDGPAEAYHYFHGHLTNFVDPVVRATVVDIGQGDLLYSYSIQNGYWGFQDIREVGLVTGPANSRQTMQNWNQSVTHIGFGRTVIRWRATLTDEGLASISRGDTQRGFTLRSRVLPAIVEAYAGHNLHYEAWRGLVTDITTPAGGRVIRFTVGPRNGPIPTHMHTMLGELVPGVHRAAELGWIDNELAGALGRALGAAATAAKAGETDTAIARLERLLDLVTMNAGVQINEEAYALIAFNVEYVLDRLRMKQFVPESCRSSTQPLGDMKDHRDCNEKST